jgi:hypothetical protein
MHFLLECPELAAFRDPWLECWKSNGTFRRVFNANHNGHDHVGTQAIRLGVLDAHPTWLTKLKRTERQPFLDARLKALGEMWSHRCSHLPSKQGA